MKQRITPEDLKQLTPEQQERLRELWQPKHYDVFYYKGNEHVIDGDVVSEKDIASSKNEFINQVNLLPLLSIGQLLKLLYSHSCDNQIESAGAKWFVGCGGHINAEGIELVDCLWDAVKSIL